MSEYTVYEDQILKDGSFFEWSVRNLIKVVENKIHIEHDIFNMETLVLEKESGYTGHIDLTILYDNDQEYHVEPKDFVDGDLILEVDDYDRVVIQLYDTVEEYRKNLNQWEKFNPYIPATGDKDENDTSLQSLIVVNFELSQKLEATKTELQTTNAELTATKADLESVKTQLQSIQDQLQGGS